MTQKHTPVPWKVSDQTTSFWIIGDADARDEFGDDAGIIIGQMRGNCKKEISKANAEFIVRVCNAYDELTDALQNLINTLGTCSSQSVYIAAGDAIIRANSILAKARGEV